MVVNDRKADAPTWVERLAALKAIKGHHDWLRDQAEPLAARGARTRWLEGAIALAATPAASHDEATAKVECFRGALASGLATDAVLDGQEHPIAMIVAASDVEGERWSLTGSRVAPARGEWTSGAEPSLEDAEAYLDAGRRWTIGEASGRVGLVERDLNEVRRANDPEAVAGAIGRLRSEIVRAAATPVSTIGDLETKQAILCRGAGICEPAWLIDPMIGACLLLDHRSLTLPPFVEARLRRELPFEPVRRTSGASSEPSGPVAHPRAPYGARLVLVRGDGIPTTSHSEAGNG